MELPVHHPFRSPESKDEYLAWYDARAKRWPVPSETRMVDTSFGQTFVRISGAPDGAPLVLLPGAGLPSLQWEFNIEALSRGHRVYAADNIYDFGRSVFTRPVKSIGDYVTWVDDLFSALSLTNDINLMGISYGG